MIHVWVLVFVIGGWSGGPKIIDNIATRAECERVAVELIKLIPERFRNHSHNLSQCIEVMKVKQ